MKINYVLNRDAKIAVEHSIEEADYFLLFLSSHTIDNADLRNGSYKLLYTNNHCGSKGKYPQFLNNTP